MDLTRALALLALSCTLGCRAPDPGKPDTGAPEADPSPDTDTADSADTDDSAPDSADTSPPPVDADADGYTDDVDCDDGDATVYPGAPEDCSTVDHDCDGLAMCDADDAWATLTERYYNTYEVMDAGDFDGDGRGELWIGTGTWEYESYHYVLNFAGMAAGTQDLSNVVGVQTSATWGLQSVPLGDVDGDGLADLSLVEKPWDDASADWVWEDAWGVWLSDGVLDGRTLERGDATWVTGEGVGYPLGLWGGDLDGDGAGEVLTRTVVDASYSFAFVPSTWFARDDWTYRDMPGIDSLPSGGEPRSVGDIDGDGLDDLSLYFGYVSPTLIVPGSSLSQRYEHNELPGLQAADCTSGYSPTLSAAGDVDGDGLPDVAANCSESSVVVLSSAALMTGFDPEAGVVVFPLVAGTQDQCDEVVWADLDGSGFSDIAVSYFTDDPTHDEGFTAVYVDSRAGSYEPADAAWIATGRADYENIAHEDKQGFLPDLTGDGIPEFFGMPSNEGWNRLSIFSGADMLE